MTRARQLEERYDTLREEGVALRDLYRGQRTDHERCSTCNLWEPSPSAQDARRHVCSCWLTETSPGAWCGHYEPRRKPGSIDG